MSNSESKDDVVVPCRFAIRSYLFERNEELKKKNIPNWQEIVSPPNKTDISSFQFSKERHLRLAQKIITEKASK